MELERNNLNFSSFLKNEFGILPSDGLELENEQEVEVVHKKLKRRLGKIDPPKLAEVLHENILESEKIDIDDKIDAEWREVFTRIRSELTEIDNVLLDVPVKKNKSAKKPNTFLLNILKSEYSSFKVAEELGAHSLFVKLSVTCAVVMFLALSIGIFTPRLADKILASVDDFAEYTMSSVTRNVTASQEYYEEKRSHRIIMDDQAKSDFIQNNAKKLQNSTNSKIQVTAKDLGMDLTETEEKKKEGKVKSYLQGIIDSIRQ